VSAGPDPPAVDLRSDTVTRPTRAMREAMAAAPVGDDVLDGDPTVARLERAVARRLGKEAALFFPSGCQGNQTALAVHARPGTEVVCDDRAHVLHYELGAPAVVSGAQLRPVPTRDGIPSAEAWEAAVRPGDRYHPETSLLWVENTHNLHGGVAVPVEVLREVREVADRRGLPVHLDGARLWNAAAATGTPLPEYAGCAETVMVTLSKGLGCPVGSLLAGSREAISKAWTVRKRLGGGMRQAGILAAAGLHALEEAPEEHLGALEGDHRRARRLAEGCAEIPGLDAGVPDTNIVMLGVRQPAPSAGRLEAALGERGIRMIAMGSARLRAVTHRDVDDAGIERTLEALRAAVAAGER